MTLQSPTDAVCPLRIKFIQDRWLCLLHTLPITQVHKLCLRQRKYPFPVIKHGFYYESHFPSRGIKTVPDTPHIRGEIRFPPFESWLSPRPTLIGLWWRNKRRTCLLTLRDSKASTSWKVSLTVWKTYREREVHVISVTEHITNPVWARHIKKKKGTLFFGLLTLGKTYHATTGNSMPGIWKYDVSPRKWVCFKLDPFKITHSNLFPTCSG